MKLKRFSIPLTAKYIGDYAFYCCYSLSEIIIPSTTTYIGDYAFFNCYSLSEITIPSSVISIGNHSFEGCTKLTEIIIPSSVTSIGDFIVSNDINLRKIIIPSNVQNIGQLDFQGFTYLTEFSLPSTVTRINEKAFKDCSSLKMIEIPSSVTIIEQYAFSGCSSLKEITIPPSTTSIENGAFLDCALLTKVNIQSSLTLIGFKAFGNCKSLVKISIPSVKKIGFNAFQYCESLKKITVPTQDIEILTELPEAFKIVMIGGSNTGKTCIMIRFAEEFFDDDTLPTIGVDFKIKMVNIQGHDVKLQIWDTAGQERFRNITRSYYPSMKGAIVVFDLTDMESFNKVSDYFNEIGEFDKKLPSVLLGNKSDLVHKVSNEDILAIVSKYNTKYFEVSAKDDININDAFQYLANEVANVFLAEKDRLLSLINNDAQEQNERKCNIS